MGATEKQKKVREAFKKCVICFRKQPKTGGATPPAKGPRGRDWWYEQAGSMWYYNYFIRESWYTFYQNGIPDWCRSASIIPTFSVCIAYDGYDTYKIEDGIEHIAGITYSSWPNVSAYARSCVRVPLTDYSLEDIEEASDLIAHFKVENSYSRDCFLYFREFVNPDDIYPTIITDIPDNHSILFSQNFSTGYYDITFSLKDYAIFHKENSLDFMWIAIHALDENYRNLDINCSIYMQNHSSTPCDFFLTYY